MAILDETKIKQIQAEKKIARKRMRDLFGEEKWEEAQKCIIKLWKLEKSEKYYLTKIYLKKGNYNTTKPNVKRGRKEKKEYALYKGDEFLAVGTISQIANIMGVKPQTIRYYRTPTYAKKTKSYNKDKMILKTIKNETHKYALYKGDEFLTDGTISEIANKMGVTEATIRHYRTPTYAKRSKSDKERRILIDLEE